MKPFYYNNIFKYATSNVSYLSYTTCNVAITHFFRWSNKLNNAVDLKWSLKRHLVGMDECNSYSCVVVRVMTIEPSILPMLNLMYDNPIDGRDYFFNRNHQINKKMLT